MRNIKFRALKDGRWFYFEFAGGGLHWSNELLTILADRRGTTEFECFVQFTGLKDKNGKEIYEGDILNEKHDKAAPGGGWISGTFGFHPENAVLVEWHDGSWVCDYVKPLAHELRWRKQWGGLEIIGNRWENPELLEPKP